MISYRRPSNDRRLHGRMEINIEVSYRFLDSPKVYSASTKNLSAGGLLMQAEQPLLPGTIIQLRIHPQHIALARFESDAVVLRCEKIDTESKNIYLIASKFQKVFHTKRDTIQA